MGAAEQDWGVRDILCFSAAQIWSGDMWEFDTQCNAPVMSHDEKKSYHQENLKFQQKLDELRKHKVMLFTVRLILSAVATANH